MDFEKFLLVFLRCSVLIPLLPIFGGAVVPAHVKAGLSLALAFLLTPIVQVPVEGPVLYLVVREILIAAALGFSVQLVFHAVVMAAQWMSVSMGLTMATIFDPSIGGMVSPVTQFLNFLTIVVFFSFDLHHQMILGIVQTFQALPTTASLAAGAFEMVRMLFAVAFKLATPILLVLVMSNLVLGFIAKALPQANLLVLGLPINAALGILALMLFLPYIIYYFGTLRFIPAWR